MVTFDSGNITASDIEKLVDDVVAANAYHLAEEAGCDLSISVDQETFEPTIYVVTNDRLISVRVETETMYDSVNKEDIGWGFVPRLGTSQTSSIFEDAEQINSAVAKFEKFLNVAKLCSAIAMIEIEPHKYFD